VASLAHVSFNPHPYPLPLQAGGLMSEGTGQEEGEGLLGDGGSSAPPVPQTSSPLSATYGLPELRVSAERGRGVRRDPPSEKGPKE